MKIVIVDYGMGNLHSICGALNHLGVSDVVVSSNHDELSAADKIILPGVGSFGKAINEIRDRNLDRILTDLVSERRKPILGVCLGMQIMSSYSNEDGENKGLNFVNTRVVRFEDTGLPVPHVGFNQVSLPKQESRLFQGFTDEPDFYFTHSYRMLGEDDMITAHCNYGGAFIASFEKDNIAGVQFHPELSQRNGLLLIRNFLNDF